MATRAGSRIRLLGRLAVVVCLVAFAAPSASAQVARPTCFGSVATIVGTNNEDKLLGTPGPDVIVSLDGDDVILAGGGDDKICSGNGDDIIVGEDGNDTIDGGDGSDSIEGGSGDDTIIGGPGFDALAYSAAPGPVNASLQTGIATGDGRDTIQGAEFLIGSSFDDTLTGNSEQNVLAGKRGNDTLDSGGNSDGLIGGLGDDKLIGRPNDGVAAAFLDAPGPVHADLNTGIATGEGRDALVNVESLLGSRFDDKLVGNSRMNFLVGLAGDDELVGGGGFDVPLYVRPVTASLATGTARGEGIDTLAGFEGLSGSAGPDHLTGDAKANFIDGAAGNDVLVGGGGADHLLGEAGSDRLAGGAGNDLLSGGPDNDVLDGGAGTADMASYIESATAVRASLATKRATGEGSEVSTGIESLSGSRFPDRLTGDGKPNELFGNDGDDLLSGGGGSDFLGGGVGNDTVQPGAGRDYCLDDQPMPGCEIVGAPSIPGKPEPPPLPKGLRTAQGRPSTSPSRAGAPVASVAFLTWLARFAATLPAISSPPVTRPAAGEVVRRIAEFEYSAEPVCISAGGQRRTEIAPPKIVRPVGDDGAREEAWWQGTLYRQDRKTGKLRLHAKTAWARAQLAGDFVLSGVVVWKTVNGQGSFASPVVLRVPKGKYVWNGQIFWVRSGTGISAAIEPHIVRAKTIEHRQACDFR